VDATLAQEWAPVIEEEGSIVKKGYLFGTSKKGGVQLNPLIALPPGKGRKGFPREIPNLWVPKKLWLLPKMVRKPIRKEPFIRGRS